MSARKPQPPTRCSRCKAPINWWHNGNREGRMVAVDQSADPDRGTVQKVVVGDPPAHRMFGRVLAGAELAEAVSRGEMLFVLHATSCSARRPHNPRPAHVRADLPTRRLRSRR